tara:strand:+ start:4744 stop:4923 length:180 start_codon:yes stop_codon:yes gene_type:complete
MNEPDILIERFVIVEGHSIKSRPEVYFDGKLTSVRDLVKITNQLASALNDRGCHFEVKK